MLELDLTVAGSKNLLDLEFDFIDFLFPVTLPARHHLPWLTEATLAVGRRQVSASAQALAPVY